VTRIGEAEGIDHGTPRGARQHTRRKVLPVCGPCEEAIAAERQATQREANAGKAPRYNVGPKPKADKRAAGARLVAAARDLTALERRRTARLLASRAVDVADLRELLGAVGVTAADGKAVIAKPTTTQHYRTVRGR
jgi:hypothetical protein